MLRWKCLGLEILQRFSTRSIHETSDMFQNLRRRQWRGIACRNQVFYIRNIEYEWSGSKFDTALKFHLHNENSQAGRKSKLLFINCTIHRSSNPAFDLVVQKEIALMAVSPRQNQGIKLLETTSERWKQKIWVEWGQKEEGLMVWIYSNNRFMP